MPLFEYTCQSCEHRFETLVRSGEKPACPKCGHKKLERHLSAFAVSTGGSRSTAPSASPCGSCGDPRGPGSCRFGS